MFSESSTSNIFSLEDTRCMSGELDSTGLLGGTSGCWKSTKTAGILRFFRFHYLLGSGEKRLVFELQCEGKRGKAEDSGMFLFRLLFFSSS